MKDLIVYIIKQSNLTVCIAEVFLTLEALETMSPGYSGTVRTLNVDQNFKNNQPMP